VPAFPLTTFPIQAAAVQEQGFFKYGFIRLSEVRWHSSLSGRKKNKRLNPGAALFQARKLSGKKEAAE
jgi:hypothetical protein